MTDLRAAVRENALLGGERGRVLALVAVGWLSVFGTRFVLPAVLPAMRTEFGVDNAAVGLAVTVVWATYALTQLPGGLLVDRLGERIVLVASVLAAGVGVLAAAVAPSYLPFLVASALFGLGSGLYGPPRATVLARVYDAGEGAAFGVVLAAGSVGAAILPALANLLLAELGWRALFWLAAPLFALLGAGMWRGLPAGRETDRSATGAPRTRARAVVTAVTRRSVALPVVAMGVLLFAFQGFSAFLPAYLVVEKGLSPPVAGGVYAVLFLSGAVFRWVGGEAADRVGHRPVLVAAALLSVPPLLALPVVEGVAALATLSAAFGVRLIAEPVTNAYVVVALPRSVRGSTWGLLRTGLFLFGSTGSLFVGLLADRELFDLAFLSLAALTVVAALLYGLLPARGTGRGDPPAHSG